MEAVYWVLFVVLATVVGGLLLAQGKEGSIVPPSGPLVQTFLRLRNNYLLVYSLMMAGDWLQGPYVYALYSYYGFDVKDIGRLFIAGFGSSMIFGTIVGSLADKHGRKKASLLYVVLYAISCATKHSPNYWVLMFGRLLGGIATSLLFSAFESWIVAEHFSKGLDEKWLGDTFSKAVFLGNGLVAILAGLVANYLVETMSLGPVAPFDASAIVLLLGGAVIILFWGENYGDSKHNISITSQFKQAAAAIMGDTKIALLGSMQSLFEASMYTFVFLWTPALSPKGESIPHGMIFACFMTASMVGSALSSVLMKRMRPELFMKFVFGVGGAALMVPCLFHLSMVPEPKPAGGAAAAAADGVREMREVLLGDAQMQYHSRSALQAETLVQAMPVGISLDGQIQLLAFCVFEVTVGVFWPSMMTMRAHYVPEDMRSTILNCFRIPLNLFVCIILYNVHLFPLSAMFGLCAFFLAVATMCQMRLEKLARTGPVIKGMPEADPLIGS